MEATHTHGVTGDADYATRLGLVLRTARYIREMSRDELAAQTDFNAETIARWERGDVTVPGYALPRLEAALMVAADLLVDPPATRADVLVRIAAYDAVRAPTIEREP